METTAKQILLAAINKIIPSKNMLDERRVKFSYSEIMALITFANELHNELNNK